MREIILFSHHRLLKRRPFPIEHSWLSCHLLVDHVYIYLSIWVYFGAPHFVLLISLFFCQSHTVLITIALQYSLKVRHVMPPALFFFLWIALAIWNLFWFNKNFKYFFSVKNNIETLVEIKLNSVDCFWLYEHFNNINLPSYKQGISFHLFVSSISFTNVLQFLLYRSFISLVKFLYMYIYFIII